MFNSRIEVDKHVENCLKRINNEKERNMRSLAFAKLYYKVDDYKQARRYVQMYLNIKSNSAEAQHLLGNCLDKLGQKEGAADAYRSSLSFDPTQTSLILKLCQLLAENDMDIDSQDSGASYYCERAQTLDPGNQYVQQLREKLLERSGRDPNEVTQFLLNEMENRPADTDCFVRLLKHLSNNNQLKLAVNHMHLIHTSNPNLSLFLRHFNYISTSTDILLRYHRENAITPTVSTTTSTNPLIVDQVIDNQPLNWQFWMLLITTLDALVALTLEEQGYDGTGVNLAGIGGEKKGYIKNMWIYDQMVLEAVKAMDSCPDKQLGNTLLLHHRGQICFHLATLLFKQARIGLLRWREAVSAALPLIFAGYHVQPPDTTALWLEHTRGLASGLNESKKGKDVLYDAKALVKRWNIEASSRCSQLGYVLYALAKDRKTETVERARQGTTGFWREHLYKKIFVTRDYQSKIKSSFFVNSTDLLDISLRLPEPQTIRLYASAAQLQYPDSLHHLIWLYLNQYKSDNDVMHYNGNNTTTDLPFTAQYDGGIMAIAELSYPYIGGSLPLSVKNLGNCAAESLNILDIQAFVYCATLCSVQNGWTGRGSMFEERDRPPLLPAAIAEQLGSTNQINWLKAAFRIQRGECYFGIGIDKNELRMTLIRGIEVIRCIGNHGIDVSILIRLAKIFQARTKKLKSHSEIEFNEARAEIYWKATMPLLERLRNKHYLHYSTKRLFESQNKQLSDHEVQAAIEDGKLFYGVMYLKKKELEKALAQFENLKDPYATYYRAQIYEIMADEQIHGHKNNFTAEQRAQILILLTHSRDCLYLTLDRLRDPSVDRNHHLNSILSVQIESIERTLTRLQGDFEGQGDGHPHEHTGIREEGVDDDGECMVTARDILSKSLLNSSITEPSYQHAYSTANMSHHLYSTPVSHNPINSTPNVPSNRLQLFLPSSAILHSPSASNTNPSLWRDGALRRDEARPSPERLDAQLRQLSLARDATNAQLMEQNRAVLDTHRALLEELKGLREGVGGLTHTVSELKGIKPAFDELKSAVEDLQSLRNLPDMVHEMKREIAEIKSNSKQQQITDEDLYSALDEEYGADFANSMPSAATSGAGLNSGITAATLGGGLYQNIPRMAAAAVAAAGPVQQMGSFGYNPATAAAIAAATGLYPGLYPSIYSPYGGIGIQGNLPFVNPAAGAGSIDPHHTGLSVLSDYRNPLTHPQLSQHTYPGPPPPSAVVTPISANMQITSLNYPPPISTLGHLQQPNLGLYSAGGQVNLGTTMTPSPLGGMGGVQLQNIFKDTASISVGGNKTGFNLTSQVISQPPQSILSQGLSGLNLFGGITSAPSIPAVYASAATTSPAAFSGLSFSNLGSSVTTPSFTSLMTSSSTICHPATCKPAPVNVVITSSDPLPIPTTTQSPILSVIIPPQHIKSKQQPHNYQIPLPTTSALTAPPSVLNQPVSMVTTQGMLAKVGPPLYSIIGEKKDKSFGNEINRSNPSSASFEEHDAQADFRPIIPLPDEVEVVTGEEDEKILFCARGKLYRYIEGQWKERGIGDIKLLQNKDEKVRILMRRERVHKICANHYITGDMQFGPKDEMDSAFVWIANDFADETLTLDTFCIRFKTADIAAEFAVQFEKVQTAAKMQESASKDSYINIPKVPVTNLGGFAFSSTPSFKPKDDVNTTVTPSKPFEIAKSSPFAGFTFTTSPKASDSKTSTPIKPESSQKSSKSFGREEFVPTAEFKPVIPLPGLVDVKTGEENSEVLFECHSKLLRFDASNKDWKERGIGEMKILKDNKIIRFLMRREQVLKVCCNHQLFHSIEFTKMPNSPKVINWYAQDYSKAVLELQMFALKFKNEELANAFLKAIADAKNLIDANGNVLVPNDRKAAESGEHEKKVKTSTSIAPTKTSGFGDKYKLKSDSWACKNCYIHNEGKDNYCIACETPKNDSVPKKPEETRNTSFTSGFSFGIPNSTSGLTNALNSFSFENSKNTSTTYVSNSSTISNTFGNAFKPEEGSWACNECYVRNKVGSISCSSCTTPKESAMAANTTVNTTTANTNLPSGLTFLATAGNVGNTAQSQFNFGFPPGNIGGGFTFGTNTVTSATTSSSFTFLSNPTTITSKATLAANSNSVVQLNTPSITTSTNAADFTFGSSSTHRFDFQPRQSPRKHSNSLNQSADSNDSNVSDGGEQQDTGGGDGGDGDQDSCLQEEEEDKIYFKPVIPLPDEVAVVTGEEEEKVVYEHRAKLFRYGDGQWKERGTGSIKILIKEGSGKARAVMRREHVHKVCLNHYITSEISYTAKSEQSWQFAAADFSEDFVNYRQFCLRFRTAEIALQFKAAVDEVMGRISSGGSGDTISTGAKAKLNSSDSDVIFISETQITEAEMDEAIKLKLPPKFMSYRQLPDCTCDQCKIDDLYYKVDVKIASATTHQYTTVATSIITTTPTVSIKPTETLKDLVQKPPSFFFGQPTTTPSTSSGPSTVFGGVSIFGNTGGSSTTPKASLLDQQSSSLFGTTGGAGTNLFVTTSNTLTPFFQITTATTAASIFSSPSNSIFGNPATSNSSIFNGGNTSKITPVTSNLFGLPTSNAPSLFGGGTTSKAFEGTTNYFGPSSATTSGFFGTPTTTTSLFGTPTNIFATTSTSANTTNMFGTSTSSNTTAPLTKNIFIEPNGSASSTRLLHDGNSNYNVVENSVLGEQSKNNEDKEAVSSALTDPSGGKLMFSAADSMCFATLAADIGATSNVFKSDSTFTFANVGAPVFAKRTTKPKARSSTSKNDDGNGDTSTSGNAADNETYDPHYEPVIPLPDEIVVTTGEEDEDIKFSQKAKLYRYKADTKEWKERGTGNIKLLFNSQTGVYRLLLRRDAVHKIVLNCRVTKDMNLLPLSKSEKSYFWFAHNFLEETGNVEQEKLAAQFTNTDCACLFYRSVKEAINHMIKLSIQVESKTKEIMAEVVVQSTPPLQALPTILPQINAVQSGVSFTEPQQNDDYGDENDDEEESDDGDDDYNDYKNIMSSKPCKLSERLPSGNVIILGEGLLQMSYDEDCFAVRINFIEPDGEVVSSSLVEMNTLMTMDGEQCCWTSVESAHEPNICRNLIATFETFDDAQECYVNFQTGKSYAQPSDIQDTSPSHSDSNQ